MNLKNKLKTNSTTFGSWITIGHQSIVEILATAGFDWLVVDMEHGAISIEKVQELILAIQSKQISALVRVGANDDLLIKQVLDAGADGVIIPMVNSGMEADKAVKAVKYQPFGKRGVGLARAQNYGIGFDAYRRWLENDCVIIVQVEHKNSVKNIKDIISVDGIDGLIIGPYDLSASYGIPGEFDNPKIVNAISEVERVCKNARFPFGYHVIKPNYLEVQEKVDIGYSFIAFSIDFFFLGEKAREEMGKLKNDSQ
jgi:2-dehydro-3-deoxyglucarate aldolase